MGHFDGSNAKPTLSSTPTDEQVTKLAQWVKNEAAAKNLLLQKLPDSTAMKIHCQTTVKATWDTINQEYTKKSVFAQTELCTTFLKSKCSKKGNIRQFLDDLRSKREELSSVGVDIDEKDYHSTIISSLPTFLSNFTSSQLAAAKFYSSTKTIDPDALISLISEEYEWQKSQHTRHAGGSKPKDESDEALAADLGKHGKGKTSPVKCKQLLCWNCNEDSHLSCDCPHPKKSKDNKPKDF